MLKKKTTTRKTAKKPSKMKSADRKRSGGVKTGTAAKTKPAVKTGKTLKSVKKPVKAVKAVKAGKTKPGNKSKSSVKGKTSSLKAVESKTVSKTVKAVLPVPPSELPARISPERKGVLRTILLQKKQEVWKDVKERLFTRMGKEYHEEVDFSLDEADKATVDLAAETGFSLIDMRKETLDKIDRALAKLEEGTYGICEECGAEIHENRLKVVPFAIYCIECKTRQEEMEKIAREVDRFSVPGQEEID